MTLRLPHWMVWRLAAFAAKVKHAREPDVIIGGVETPYLLRWFIIPRNPVFNIYLHEFRRSDDDRALHDHPWINCSIVVDGEYAEHCIRAGGINTRTRRRMGDVVMRGPRAAHRVERIAGGVPPTTIFLTGPRVRRWGFHCPGGWVHWKKFTSPDGREVGAGCGEVE